jgi:hypothetical protein
MTQAEEEHHRGDHPPCSGARQQILSLLLGIPVPTAYTRLRAARQIFRAVAAQHFEAVR